LEVVARSTVGADQAVLTAVLDVTRRSEPAAVVEARHRSPSRLTALAGRRVAKLALDQRSETAAVCMDGVGLLPTTVALDVTAHPVPVIRSCRTIGRFVQTATP
jgi:hypothetical protein